MKKLMIMATVVLFIGGVFGCKKGNPTGEFQADVDYFKVRDKPKYLWNELDYLCDSIHKEYGVKIVYEYDQRTIAGTTFFVPADYTRALAYTRIMIKGFWLKPLKENFPQYFAKETPIEFIEVGGFIHFNDITSAGAAAGAGLNAQFYRLGMGGVNNFNKNDKAWLFDHIVTLYHEHAHQQDHKYGRGELYDRVSLGDYYGLSYTSRSVAQSNLDGFFKPYGGYAPEEDFATSVESMARFTKPEVDLMTSKSTKLATKYRMVYKYYLDKGMDLHKLHDVLDSVVYRTVY